MNACVIAIPAAFALGCCLVPPATDRLLAYKFKEINDTWNKSLQEYESHVRFTRRKPSVNGERYERGMALWGKRQVGLVNAKKLSFEQVQALRVVGIIPNPSSGADPALCLPRDRDVRDKYRLDCTAWVRYLCGALLAIASTVLILFNASPALLAVALVSGAIVESVFLCDMRARIIPYQLCLAFAVCAILFSLIVAGPEGLASSAALGVAMYLALQLVNKALSILSGSPAIGDGDMRFIPLICVFSGIVGTFYGFAAASAVMAVLAVGTVLFKGGNRKSYVPYAPGLSCWFAVGLVVQAAVA